MKIRQLLESEGKFRSRASEEAVMDKETLMNMKDDTVPDWEMLDHRILTAKYFAKNHRQAVQFVDFINRVSEYLDHFAEVTQDVAEVTVKTTTSDTNSLTILDFALAKAVDEYAIRNDIEQERIQGNFDEAAGVGIVTKQNATADVPVGGEYQNVKKLFPKKKKSKTETKINEAVPAIIPALATAMRIGTPMISRLLSREGAKEVAKGVAKNAGKAAAITGKTVIKNPGKTAAAYGAYTVWDTVNDAIEFLEDIGLDSVLVPAVAKVMVQYAIPASAVLAALYGGKKLYDYLKSENDSENQEIIDAFEKEFGKTETKEAPRGHYFTKSGNLVKGRLTKDAKERGARQTDPKDNQRSKIPKVTQYNEGACPRTRARVCECSSVNSLTESQDTITAVCVLEHSGTVKGTILFKQTAGGPTFIAGRITGLEPGEHGFHIHQLGDMSQGCKSMGPHYNPEGVDHGDLDQGHVGDLGNITADDSGTATVKIVAERVDLTGEQSVIGRGIVVHADRDDLGKGGDAESLKTGNAGDRLACGVITLKETVEEDIQEGCKYGTYYCSTDKKYKCRKSPKKSRKTENLDRELEMRIQEILESTAGITDAWFKDGFKTFKKPAKEKYEIADADGTVKTLEGPVSYKKGYYIMTGPKGEQYPMPPEKFRELKDDHGNGVASSKKIIKTAKLADHDGSVNTSWGATLEYRKGQDYIVRHGANDYGVVKADIFQKTYDTSKANESLEEITRRDLLKGIGVAGAAAATGAKVDVAKAFSEPKDIDRPGYTYYKVEITIPGKGTAEKNFDSYGIKDAESLKQQLQQKFGDEYKYKVTKIQNPPAKFDLDPKKVKELKNLQNRLGSDRNAQRTFANRYPDMSNAEMQAYSNASMGIR